MNNLKIESYIALDLETGINPSFDKIIEIGMVKKVIDGKEVDSYNTLINPRYTY